MDEWTSENVLITVMTYPHPSRGYKEIVCTAGINDKGEWVRLYPIDFRHRPKGQQFKKYQWINVNLKTRAASEDKRKESREPDLHSISLIGQALSSKNQWADRRKIIDRMPHCTLEQLKSQYDVDKTSLGIVQPSKVHDLEVKRVEGEWKLQWKGLYAQLDLFGRTMLPLRKIPFKFSYIFSCADDASKRHTAMIEDWELGALWLNLYKEYGNEELAAEKVKQKYLEEICAPDKETRFFMGTVYPYNSWVVLGVFWPPRKRQLSLLEG